jgi:hypothetical protein
VNAAKQHAADTRWAADRGETLTVPQRILKAAASLPQPFHETDLIVCAWRDSPELFGLRGREAEHPDANRARCAVQGSKGLVARGWLAKAREYHYELTRRGRAEADRLVASNGTAPRAVLPRVAVPPDLDDYLTACFEGEAYRRWVCGRLDTVSKSQALAFWGCADGDDGETVRFGVAQLDARLSAAADYATVPLACGCEVSDELLQRLRKCSEALVAKFGRKLGVSA